MIDSWYFPCFESKNALFANVVPFLLEEVLQANGGIYSKTENWQPYAVEDGLLITGQNPASSKLVAQKLIEKLNK